MHPAIFLDRDGVIVENRSSYIRSWADIQIFPHAMDALARLSRTSYKTVIVTNQSAVGRGIISLELAWEINHRLVEIIEAAGGRVDGVFMCPHVPDVGCDCRKPKPGLLIQAARVLSVDLSQSLMIGDALTDVMAGQAAGIGCAVLLRTGLGASQALLPVPAELKPFQTYETLSDALAQLVKI